jgi:hypothetical protein
VKQRFTELGPEMASFEYKKVLREMDGLPWIIEAAFAWSPDAGKRRLITGVNWSPGIMKAMTTMVICKNPGDQHWCLFSKKS